MTIFSTQKKKKKKNEGLFCLNCGKNEFLTKIRPGHFLAFLVP